MSGAPVKRPFVPLDPFVPLGLPISSDFMHQALAWEMIRILWNYVIMEIPNAELFIASVMPSGIPHWLMAVSTVP